MGLKYSCRPTEEVTAWAFEIFLRGRPNWHLAFTNPTAGPWKRIMAKDPNGVSGEVHRFGREDVRPDLVVVHDGLGLVGIIEAKERLQMLLNDVQCDKSAQVVAGLAGLLGGSAANPHWAKRASYGVFSGLLWGGAEETSAGEVNDAFVAYDLALRRHRFDGVGQIAVQAIKAPDDAVRLRGWSTGERAVQDALRDLGLDR